jgi:hypothetical protein
MDKKSEGVVYQSEAALIDIALAYLEQLDLACEDLQEIDIVRTDSGGAKSGIGAGRWSDR